MRVAETSGRTVEEAIARALNQLGLNRDQVDVDVVTEGKAGFLGFGSEDAIVRVTAKDSVITTAGQRRGRAGGGTGGQRRDEGGRPPREPRDDREGPDRPDRERREGADTATEEPGDGGRRRRRGRRGGRRRRGGESEGEGVATEARSGARPEQRTEQRGEERDDEGGQRDSGRPQRRSTAPVARVRGVPPGEEIRIPGVPDELPTQPIADPEDEIDLAGSTLRDILNLLGLTETEISARDPETPGDGAGLIAQVFDIFGNDDDVSDELGVLIGRRGETLASLQYLINTVVAKNGDDSPIYSIDIEGYKRRRERTLVDMAKEIAQEVRETGDVITLEPMPAHERRIIHLALEDEPGVRTESVGSGDRRQVEILPEDE